jgi:hypothetical protein
LNDAQEQKAHDRERGPRLHKLHLLSDLMLPQPDNLWKF